MQLFERGFAGEQGQHGNGDTQQDRDFRIDAGKEAQHSVELIAGQVDELFISMIASAEIQQAAYFSFYQILESEITLGPDGEKRCETP